MLSGVSRVTSRAWRDGKVVAQDFELDDLSDWLGNDACLTWVDLLEPDPGLLEALAAELNFDRHAVEDAVAPHERPKATRHATHSFLTCYGARVETGPGGDVELVTGRISAFVLPHALVTVRTSDVVDMDDVQERWEADGLLHLGVGALVHGLLDSLVDAHFVALEQLDDAVEELDDLLFSTQVRTQQVQQRVFRLRKSMVGLRKVVLPMREVVASVMRFRAGETGTPHELDGYFDDLYDHVIRASEWLDSLRDLVASAFETNLSLQEAGLNEVMKKLAAWAAIIAVPTAVTGWFGQNIPYPGFSQATGLVQSVVLMLIGTVGLFFLFRAKRWL